MSHRGHVCQNSNVSGKIGYAIYMYIWGNHQRAPTPRYYVAVENYKKKKSSFGWICGGSLWSSKLAECRMFLPSDIIRIGVAVRVGVMDSHPHFGVVPQVGSMDSHTWCSVLPRGHIVHCHLGRRRIGQDKVMFYQVMSREDCAQNSLKILKVALFTSQNPPKPQPIHVNTFHCRYFFNFF